MKLKEALLGRILSYYSEGVATKEYIEGREVWLIYNYEYMRKSRMPVVAVVYNKEKGIITVVDQFGDQLNQTAWRYRPGIGWRKVGGPGGFPPILWSFEHWQEPQGEEHEAVQG